MTSKTLDLLNSIHYIRGMKSLRVLVALSALLFCGTFVVSQGAGDKQAQVVNPPPQYALVVLNPLDYVYISTPTGEVIPEFKTAEPVTKVQKGFVQEVFHPPAIS